MDDIIALDTTVFSPYQLGSLELKNRAVMAPLTRSRAEPGNLPSRLAAEYYSQRAGAGLIITEATQAGADGQGYVATPGIHSAEQVEAWRVVTDAVHSKGGRIFVQLWHVGRISHPDFRNGALPVAPSAIAPRGVKTFTANGPQDIPTPRALEQAEIAAIVEQFRSAACNAREAGFDGVEVHGANGYLLDQFLQDSTNHRTDDYGGRVENRARLLLEVLDAIRHAWSSDRVGVRLSPGGSFNDMADSNPAQTFAYVAEQLSTMGLAYLHLIEPSAESSNTPGTALRQDLSARFFRTLYPGTLMVCGDYTKERANAVLKTGLADLVAFGRASLANPDLVERMRCGAALNEPKPATFYGGGAEGYIDYPSMSASDQAACNS
jgi:N-ethylmaleimide reductase